MKNNSLNLVLIIFAFVVIGCSCPTLNDLQTKLGENTNKTATNSVSNVADVPKKSAETSQISVEKYNKLKNGMTVKQTVEIMGDSGEELQSSETGKYKIVTYKWTGENFSYIVVTFMNDKLQSKSKGGIK